MRRFSEFTALAFSFATASALLFILPGAAMAQETVDIGLSSPLTGPQALIGKDNRAGAEMAINELNQKKPTIAGKAVTFRLLAEDDQANPKIGVAVAAKLIEAKVKAIVGPYNSDVAISTSRMVNSAGIAMITVGTNPRITQQGFQFVFRAASNDNQLGGEMAAYAANRLKLKKVLIIEDGTAYGKGLADAFVASARAGKIDIAGRKSAEHPNAFGAILNALKGRGVDGIFYGGYSAQAAALRIAMQKSAIDAVLMGGDGICNTETAKLAGPAINDKTYCVQGGARLGARAVEKTFLADYRRLYGKSPSSFGPNFYDSVKIIAAAMQKANSTEPARFAPALASMRYSGVVGDYEFDAAHDLKNSPVTIYQFKNNEPVVAPAN